MANAAVFMIPSHPIPSTQGTLFSPTHNLIIHEVTYLTSSFFKDTCLSKLHSLLFHFLISINLTHHSLNICLTNYFQFHPPH